MYFLRPICILGFLFAVIGMCDACRAIYAVVIVLIFNYTLILLHDNKSSPEKLEKENEKAA